MSRFRVSDHFAPLAAATLAAGLLGALAPAASAGTSTAATSAAASAPAPLCHGKRATIVGTRGDDRIRGTRRADVIVGLGGNDTIRGLGGNDTICGNAGADDLFGGGGRDVLLGGTDQEVTDPELDEYWPDLLDGGAGNDLLDPGPKSRHLPNIISFHSSRRAVRVNLARGTATGQGHDRIRVNRARLAVLGSKHDDVLIGGPRRDLLMGSRGSDRIRGGAAGDQLESGAGWMKMYGYNWVPRDRAGDRDRLSGGEGRDWLTGAQRSTLLGGAGSDTLDGGHVVRGGNGKDWITTGVRSRPGQVISGGAAQDQLELSVRRTIGALESDLGTGWTTLVDQGRRFRLANVETIMLDSRRTPWTVLGTGKSERFEGSGPMTVHARGGNDHVDGSPFDDYVDGGMGRDSAWMDDGDDVCVNVERIQYDTCAAP